MSSRVDFLYLNERDMLRAGVRDMAGCMNAMEDMFLLLITGDYRMGGDNANEHGIRVSFPIKSNIKGMPLHKPDYRFMSMPAYLGGRFKIVGIKNYGSNPDNVRLGLPRSVLMLSLMDAVTGVPIAYMSANILSAMRTGATVGIGAKYLSVANPKTVAVIGPGSMSQYSIYSFVTLFPTLERVKIKGRSSQGIKKFISYCKKHFPQIKEFEICDELVNACKDSDIIFYGTTNAVKFEDNPTVKRKWLKPGALVIAASALLVDEELLVASNVKLILDNYKMYEDWGKDRPFPTQKNVSTLLGMGFYDAVIEGIVSRDSVTEMGDILIGKSTGRDNDDQIILYAVGGMPIEDVAWGYDCYQNAIKNHIGTVLNLWETPGL